MFSSAANLRRRSKVTGLFPFSIRLRCCWVIPIAAATSTCVQPTATRYSRIIGPASSPVSMSPPCLGRSHCSVIRYRQQSLPVAYATTVTLTGSVKDQFASRNAGQLTSLDIQPHEEDAQPVTEHGEGPDQRPDFELPGQCSVYPWGISWGASLKEHHSARWEEITNLIRRSESGTGYQVVGSGGLGTYLRKTGPSLPNWYYCDVYIGGRKVTFSESYSWAPNPWIWIRPVPGKTKQVNIWQLEHLIKKGMARSRRRS
jgi:hypothetical protein